MTTECALATVDSRFARASCCLRFKIRASFSRKPRTRRSAARRLARTQAYDSRRGRRPAPSPRGRFIRSATLRLSRIVQFLRGRSTGGSTELVASFTPRSRARSSSCNWAATAWRWVNETGCRNLRHILDEVPGHIGVAGRAASANASCQRRVATIPAPAAAASSSRTDHGALGSDVRPNTMPESASFNNSSDSSGRSRCISKAKATTQRRCIAACLRSSPITLWRSIFSA